MNGEIMKLKKSEYFKEGENVFIHLSDNVEFNNITHHHNFIELIYVISGTALHTIEDTSYTVKKGNVLIVNNDVPHSFSFDSSDDEKFMTYDLLFTPDFFNVSGMENDEFYSLASSYLFSSVFTEFRSEDFSKNLVKTNSREFHSLFSKIYDEYHGREKGFQNIIRAHLIELIIKFFREIDKQQCEFTQSHRELVEKAIEHMRKNYKSHISLDEIVSGMFLSKNYFRQIFKKTTGTSISSYIQELRISEACRLLRETSDSSTVIAVKCGFNDAKFFYNTFKKSVGMTPAEYRKERAVAK